MTEAKSQSQYYSNATEILPGLWLGDLKASLDTGFLGDKQIQCIINCTDRYPFSDIPLIKIKHRVPIKDNLEIEEVAKLYHCLDELADLIKQHLPNHNILIHCYAGKQRSASILIAFLMKYGQLDLSSATLAIKSKRPDVFEPSFNFEAAVKLYEDQLRKLNIIK